MINPTVFISYSHDSPEHADRVLELSNRLRADGVDCTIDQYEVSPAEGWPKWMDRQIANSDFVLVVCTEIYYRRVMGKEEKGKGLGIKWESTITYQDVYDRDSTNSKFIPILFGDSKTEFIPKPLKGASYYFLLDQYEELYRRLTDQSKVKKPELGPIRELGSVKILAAVPALERKTDFFRSDWHLAHPYPMPPNFTGRAIEQKMLDDWLVDDKDRLFILRALGGFGKSALTWQWINTHVNPAEWTKLVFWSFYEGDASFEHFIEETLKYLKLDIPQGQRPQVDELLKAMGSQKILLIMDGFERALRAYSSINAAYQGDEESPLPAGEGQGEGDCVNINAEFFLKGLCSLPNMKGKVLMTTRFTPRAVKPRGEFTLGCCEETLQAMQKADAVEFFRKQKIKGTHAEIEAACAPYGYHPLSLRLLAGRILKDFENPADVVVAQKLKIDGDLKQHQHHVLEGSYNSLPPHEGKLLSTIACFRSPVELKTLQSIAENKDILDSDLHDLVERGLLHFDDKNKRFDLHPIVRHYAYDLFLNKEATHRRLAEYFQKQANEDISQQYPNPPENFPRWLAIGKKKQVKSLDDIAPVIELYVHTLKAGLREQAARLYMDRLNKMIDERFGVYQLGIELLLGLNIEYPEEKIGKIVCSEVFRSLSSLHRAIGQFNKAIYYSELEERILRDIGNTQEIARCNLDKSILQVITGSVKNSMTNAQDALETFTRDSNGGWGISYAHHILGFILATIGSYDEAEKHLNEAIQASDSDFMQSQFSISRLNSLLDLNFYRYRSQQTHKFKFVIKDLSGQIQKKIEIAQRIETSLPIREKGRSCLYLGKADLIEGNLLSAEHNLNRALEIARTIDQLELEPETILHFAILRYHQKNYEEAKSLAEEALSITERCGYVFQGADVNLFLAQYALEQEQDKAKAKAYAETALKLATCDGPPYYYKVAYEEAERMLEKL